jgi:acetyl-CoA carboxylase carboxyl transferase subunit beta
MIDMVVHRHKLRETLARLCRLLSANSAVARQNKPIAAKLEHGYVNGNSVDGKTIETLARSSDVMEPEPLDDDVRFEARDQTEARKPRPGPGPRG